MASEKGLTIEDIDLVFVFAFDLGAKVDVKELGEAFANKYPIVEARWHPPEKPRFTLHPLYSSIIIIDRVALDPMYLELSRYARLKLVEHEADVVNSDMGKIVKKFKIEPYLLIHNTGIGVVTAWINLKGNFTTDDIITFENRIDEIKLNIKDAFGKQYKSVTLGEFIYSAIANPLQRIVKGSKELRDAIVTSHVIAGVREVKCGDRCFTAGDIVKGHVKEIAGILTRAERWRDFRNDAAEENLGRNLSYFERYAMYLTLGASLFLGSPKLKEEIEEKVSKSPLDKDTAFRLPMLGLVTPIEFLMLSVKILDVYDSFFRKRREDFQERKRRGKAVNPSEYMELRSELTEALEEYRNVEFFTRDPSRSILGYGKEVYRLAERVDVLRSALDELAELARTHYEERFAKSQLVLTVVFGIFGIFAEIEFLEKLVGLQWALAGAAMTALALVLFYRWYMGRPYKKFWPLRQSVGEQKTQMQVRQPPRKKLISEEQPQL